MVVPNFNEVVASSVVNLPAAGVVVPIALPVVKSNLEATIAADELISALTILPVKFNFEYAIAADADMLALVIPPL